MSHVVLWYGTVQLCSQGIIKTIMTTTINPLTLKAIPIQSNVLPVPAGDRTSKDFAENFIATSSFSILNILSFSFPVSKKFTVRDPSEEKFSSMFSQLFLFFPLISKLSQCLSLFFIIFEGIFWRCKFSFGLIAEIMNPTGERRKIEYDEQ